MKFNKLGFAVKQCEYSETWLIVHISYRIEKEFDTKKEAQEELRIYYS